MGGSRCSLGKGLTHGLGRNQPVAFGSGFTRCHQLRRLGHGRVDHGASPLQHLDCLRRGIRNRCRRPSSSDCRRFANRCGFGWGSRSPLPGWQPRAVRRHNRKRGRCLRIATWLKPHKMAVFAEKQADCSHVRRNTRGRGWQTFGVDQHGQPRHRTRPTSGRDSGANHGHKFTRLQSAHSVRPSRVDSR